MKQVQAGDTDQLGVLFERYNTPLFQYLLHLSRDRAWSEDLVQDVFFRVLKYAASYDPTFPFKVWLYRMARNVYFDSAYKRRGETGSSEMEHLPSDEPLMEEMLARKQETILLQEALEQLPEDKREVLVLSRFHDLRYEEIAHILKCEVGTVKVRVYRALKQLRERFCELRGEALYDA
ncbi:MAG TPA: sigma-70 family RNA polymerase sigma factor [Bryobacteraceae bacterium]|jgi:RNA polymerase sigma-70 factor (ECF subfamily)|nr:sigma-70 family RNA polymerase sigma factor [Bryobacteraceae bacterium]